MKPMSLNSTFVFSLIFICLSCSGPKVTITKDTVYGQLLVEMESEYLLGPGDAIDITYFFSTQASEKEYILQIGDAIDIEFYYHPEINKRVIIRPDGKITLARKGNINAAGLTTDELTKNLVRLYGDTFKKPSVIVSLVEFNQALSRFKEAITSDARGQSKLVLVRPDGYISLPQIPKDIEAAGATLNQLKSAISAEYSKIFENLSVSVALANTNSNLVYVTGEVRRPNSYQLAGPTTVSQILSQAGLIWETAELSSILVVSRSSEGKPWGRLVNMDEIIGQGNIGNDIFLKRFDVVYVPKNKIANANVVVDQYINRIVPNFFRLGLNFTYSKDVD
jgi:polysaccharide export outer membrane protein